MPTAEPDTPRKMLPPPITMQISTPSACTDWISLAMRPTISGSRPYSRAPISASPDSFKRTRGYLRSADMRPALTRLAELSRRQNSRYHQIDPTVAPLSVRRASAFLSEERAERKSRRTASVLQLRRNLGREIGALPLDPLAQCKTRKAFNADRRAYGFAGLLDDLRDLGLLIDDEDLLEKYELLIEFAQPPFDHSVDYRVGFAGGARLFSKHVAFAVERGLRHRGDIEIERVRRRDMHRQLLAEPGELVGRNGRAERDEDPDLAEARAERVVDIRENGALFGREALDAPQHQIFADCRDQMRQLLLDSPTRSREVRFLKRFELPIAVERQFAHAADKALKGLVARHEIGFRIDLDHSTHGPAGRHADQALGRPPPRLFCGRGQPLFSQPIDGRFDVAGTIVERPFAIHHPGAGLLAQLLDQHCRYLGHNIDPPVKPCCSGKEVLIRLSRSRLVLRCALETVGRGFLGQFLRQFLRSLRDKSLFGEIRPGADIDPGGRELGLQPVENRPGHEIAIEMNRPHRIVVSRDRIGDTVG